MGKHGTTEPKKQGPKRLVVELAPGIRSQLKNFIENHNADPARVTSPLNLTDVTHEALDAFLSRVRPES